MNNQHPVIKSAKKTLALFLAAGSIFALSLALDDPSAVPIVFTRIAGAAQGFATSVPLSWEEVTAAAGQSESYNFRYELAEQLADNNMMRMLSFAYFKPEERDWLGYYDADVYEFPPSMAMKLLLIGAEYKRAKVTFLQNLTKHLLSPEVKERFDYQRDSLILDLKSRLAASSDSAEKKILPKIIARAEYWKYEDALRKACDFYSSLIDGVDYTRKVILDGSDIWSIILKGSSADDAEYFEDDSPYRIRCLFYRLGPKASREIKLQFSAFKAKVK